MKKKDFIFSLFFIILCIILIYLLLIFFRLYKNKTSFEKDILKISENTNNVIFSVDKIALFSSCNANTSMKPNSSYSIDNLYQYTDIAIFINNLNSSSSLSYENTLKEVYIDNISFSKVPELGSPELYYKNLNDFSKSMFDTNNKIEKKISFNITSENDIDYNSPILYNNCANPITLCYVNNNIKSDYIIDTSNAITYDGSLLKKCNILLSSINCSISFDLFITNNLNQNYKCPIVIDIPLQNNKKSIYDGYLVENSKTKFIFYKYE